MSSTIYNAPRQKFRTSPWSTPALANIRQAAAGGAAPQQNNGNGGGAYNNPYYDQLASMYRAQGAAEAAGMRDSIRQMLIGLGLAPANFQDKFGALDPTTRALIQKNTDTGISTYARLNEQKGLGIKDLINRLNARGLRRSGARGYGLRKNQLNYDRNLSDVISQLMQQVGGMYSGYSQNEYARQAALIQAAMNYYGGSYNSSSNNPASSNPGASGPSGMTGGSPTGGTYNEMGDTYPIYDFGGGWLGF